MRRTFMPTVALGLAAIGAGWLMLRSAPADAADQAKEVETAAIHAGLAAASKDILLAHIHLHHTINCLVGPRGAGYDDNEMNPCVHMGDGALPDTTDTTQRKALEAALEHATAGLAVNELAAVQKIATEIQTQLKAVK